MAVILEHRIRLINDEANYSTYYGSQPYNIFYQSCEFFQLLFSVNERCRTTAATNLLSYNRNHCMVT